MRLYAEESLALAQQLTLLQQDTGLVERWVPNQEQRSLLASLCEHDRVIVLKGRQQGISTVCCLYDLMHCIVHPRHTVAIVTDVQEKSEALLAKCSSWAKQCHLHVAVDNVRTMVLANGSSIEAKSAVAHAEGGESRVGRSKSYSMIHLSEMAFMRSDSALFAALTSTLLPGGKIVIESTASPADNLYARIWHGHDDGWRRLFFSVEDHVAYRMPESSITDEQWAAAQAEWSFRRRDTAAWWVHKLQCDMAGDKFRMMREYPITSEQAFMYAEGRWIHSYMNAVCASNGPWTEYDHEDEPVVFGVDTGAGVGGDHSALAVLGRRTGRLHATWTANGMEVPDFVDVVVQAAKKWSPAAVVVEGNGIGAGTLSLIKRAQVPCIEHTSTAAEKAIRFPHLRSLIESGNLPIGPELQSEVKSSVVDRAGKYTGRDDLLSAVSFALTHLQKIPYVEESTRVDPTVYVTPEWRRPKKRHKF